MTLSQEEIKKGKDTKKFYYITSLSSIVSGIVAKIICHPLDTIRAKLQVQQQYMTLDELKKRMMINAYKQTIQQEGLKGLYKGLGISIIGTGPAFSLYLTTYEIAKKNLNSYEYLREKQAILFFLSGLIAETISCIFWLPIDVIKERLQVQKNLNLYEYKNSFDAIQQISKSEGLIGLYRAYGATLASFGPYSAFYFLFYEEAKSISINHTKYLEIFLLNPNNPNFLESMTLSGLAASMAGTLVNPLEIVKLRMQVQRATKTTIGLDVTSKGNFGYKNLFHGIYLIVKKEGFGSLWKGTLAKIMYNAPNTAICMSVAEILRTKILQKYN